MLRQVAYGATARSATTVSAQIADTYLALAQRADDLHPADERADDLQCPSPAILGKSRRELRYTVAADRADAEWRWACGDRQQDLHTDDRSVGTVDRPAWRRPDTRFPLLGDDPQPLQPVRRAALAFPVRMGAGTGRHGLFGDQPD